MHLLADFDYLDSCLQGDSEQEPKASEDAAFDATMDEEGEAPATEVSPIHAVCNNTCARSYVLQVTLSAAPLSMLLMA